MTQIAKSKTVLSTVTHYVDEGIVHIHFTTTSFELPELIRHYSELESRVLNKQLGFIYSFESMWLKPLTHEARMYNNAMLANCTSALTAVAPSPMLKSFINFYIRISKLPFPAKAFGSMEECLAYLRSSEIELQRSPSLKTA